jgi:hypothetical protein
VGGVPRINIGTWGLCDCLCLVLVCRGRYGLGGRFFSSFWDRVWADITRLLAATGSRHTTRPAHAVVGGHHTTVSPHVLYCVPTNPGPRSFHAWAIRRCHWPVPQPIVQLLKPGPLNSTNQYPISPDPEYLGPRESISDNTLFHVSSSSSRHAPARD